jgi:glutamate synthase (ferredoxin)
MGWIIGGGIVCLLIAVIAYDLLQRQHAVLRNFPVIGHFRYWIETIGPELRQYIVAGDNEERPFDRNHRSWVYRSAKKIDNYFGFGTDHDLELTSNYLIIKHSAFPLSSPTPGAPHYDDQYRIECAKVMGGFRKRKLAFRPRSVINISGMSYGSLSSVAVEALNRGARLAGCLQSTGEGSVTPHHGHGGELIWQIGTGYFGCRTVDGQFSKDRMLATIQQHPHIRAIEIKLSQGAKPGAGGILPRRKITPEIAAIRGIPRDRDCISPAAHTAFHDPDSLLDFVEEIADATGLPVGIKSAVGESGFWSELADLIATTDRAVDFITIDGGEGGTGAGPLVFADHVALPFKQGFARVERILAERGVDHRIVLIGSGKLGFPEEALFGFAIGCDMIHVAREAMLAIGCIQAQKCHTNHCPTGVATQNRWLMRGLNPELKSARVANYVVVLRKELLALSRACGVEHPAMVSSEHLEVIDDRLGSRTLKEVFGYESHYGLPSAADREEIVARMRQVPSNR